MKLLLENAKSEGKKLYTQLDMTNLLLICNVDQNHIERYCFCVI